MATWPNVGSTSLTQSENRAQVTTRISVKSYATRPQRGSAMIEKCSTRVLGMIVPKNQSGRLFAAVYKTLR
jgi:hypothetical protein